MPSRTKPKPQSAKRAARNNVRMKMTSLEDLFVNEIQDLYDAEEQMLKALPTMIRQTSSRELLRIPMNSSSDSGVIRPAITI
jgi:hypothetical protein